MFEFTNLVLLEAINILSYELAIRTNGTQKDWKEYSLVKSLDKLKEKK